MSSSSYSVAIIIFAILIAAGIVVLGPIFTLLALNTVFNLSIPITFWTWLSTFWLGCLFIPQKSYFKSKD